MSETANRAVFLSYASQDAEAAKRICDSLRAAGIEVWFDQNELVGGDQWDQKIRRQIQSCALCVPIISANTQSRTEGYFRLEWRLAEQRTHLMAKGRPFLVPIVIDETRDTEAHVPESFLEVQWSRFPGGECDDQFATQVQQLLTGEMPLPSGSVQPSMPNRWLWYTVPSMIIGLAYAIVPLFKSQSVDSAPLVGAEQHAVKAAPAAQPAAVISPALAAVEKNNKSIAVLPFTNMSPDPDNAFFADGIHEDVLTNLGVIRELHVVSRTSVMQYRKTTKPIPQIGAELGVVYVLEGSVRRVGNKVRVTGQLIDTRNDAHVWAKSYDRDLTDIFSIQAELAEAIAQALAAVLSPQEKSLLESRPTTNAAAYDLYLKARASLNGYTADMTLEEVEAALIEAVKLDPKFAEAWGYLSFNHVSLYFHEFDRSSQRLAKAKAAIETAVQLAPNDPVVLEMQGNYYYYGYRDYARATEFNQRLLSIRPNSAEAYAQIGLLYRRQGRWAEALSNLRRASLLDPRNTTIFTNLGETLEKLRRYDEALVDYRRAIALAPGDLYMASEIPLLAFSAHGSTHEMDDWLAVQKPSPDDESLLTEIRVEWASMTGGWSTAMQLSEEMRDKENEPDWEEEYGRFLDLIGIDDLETALELGNKIKPQLDDLLLEQDTNSLLWYFRAMVYALAGDQESALRCAHRIRALLTESADAVDGPGNSEMAAQIHAWAGDKEGALIELARLLRTPSGSNVHHARFDIGWQPLFGDPRFEALLIDPKNNEPLF